LENKGLLTTSTEAGRYALTYIYDITLISSYIVIAPVSHPGIST